MKMTREHLDEWLEGLRSGKYAQAKNALMLEDIGTATYSYCCLGVLCDLNVQRLDLKKERDEFHADWAFDDMADVLPDKVKELFQSEAYGFEVPVSLLTEEERKVMWVRNQHVTPVVNGEVVLVELPPPESFRITTLNDEGFTFTRIAELIEQIVEVIPA